MAIARTQTEMESVNPATEEVLGARQPSPGFFYTPTILAGITPDMPVYREETFLLLIVVSSL